jgi:hypothetical protein
MVTLTSHQWDALLHTLWTHLGINLNMLIWLSATLKVSPSLQGILSWAFPTLCLQCHTCAHDIPPLECPSVSFLLFFFFFFLLFELFSSFFSLSLPTSSPFSLSLLPLPYSLPWRWQGGMLEWSTVSDSTSVSEPSAWTPLTVRTGQWASTSICKLPHAFAMAGSIAQWLEKHTWIASHSATTSHACPLSKVHRQGIPRWQLEGGSRKQASYSEILERRWRHTLQA